MKKNIYALFSVLLMSLALQADISDAGVYLKENVVTKKLDNGITVIMLNRGYAPTLAFQISFRVGSVDESYQTTGAAHLLEHMLFKGTDKVGTKNFVEEKKILDRIDAVGETLDILKLSNPHNQMIPGLEQELQKLQVELRKYVISSPYDKIYTAHGSRGLNASTSKDKTGYYIELPASKLELWAKLESERLRNPIMREYYLERNNVFQERMMRTDSRGFGTLYEQFIANAFTVHPYRHPIIGWGSKIPFLSINDIRKFYWKYYIPSRMTITIVGMQDPNKTLELIKKYFGKIKPGIEPKELALREPKQRGEKRFSIYFKSNPHLIIGWHKPTLPSRDDFVSDVISELLAGGKSSILYKKLVLEKRIVSAVDAWNGSPGARYDNLFMITAKPIGTQSVAEVEKIIYEEIEKLARTVSDQDIQKVVNKMESDLVFNLSTNMGIANLLSYYQTVTGDWAYVNNYLQVIKSITTNDVKSVIKKYFIPENRVVGILKTRKNKMDK